MREFLIKRLVEEKKRIDDFNAAFTGREFTVKEVKYGHYNTDLKDDCDWIVVIRISEKKIVKFVIHFPSNYPQSPPSVTCLDSINCIFFPRGQKVAFEAFSLNRWGDRKNNALTVLLDIQDQLRDIDDDLWVDSSDENFTKNSFILECRESDEPTDESDESTDETSPENRRVVAPKRKSPSNIDLIIKKRKKEEEETKSKLEEERKIFKKAEEVFEKAKKRLEKSEEAYGKAKTRSQDALKEKRQKKAEELKKIAEELKKIDEEIENGAN